MTIHRRIRELKRFTELSGLFHKTLQVFGVYAVIVTIWLVLIGLGATNKLRDYSFYLSFVLLVGVSFFVFKNLDGIMIRLGESSNINILTDCIAIIVLEIIDIRMKIITHSVLQFFLWLSITIVIIIIVIIVRKLRTSYYRKSQTSERTAIQSPEPLESMMVKKLLNWSQNDNPIENIKQDYFDHDLISRRMTQYLENSISTKIPSIGLRGEYGAGKTTIINFMKQRIQYNDPKKYIFCVINCWGFLSAKSVLQYIIEKMIQSMTQKGIYTDLLIKIPQRYIRALSKIHTTFDVIFSFLENDRNDPEKLLKKIGRVLELERKQLILVIENLDRNESDDFTIDDIQATLMRIKEISHISFILTGFPHSNEQHVDFERLCDYIEEV
jgi:hypothetical protein